MLRIIAGEYKGRIIKTLEGTKTRPTTDRVKESLFNILQHRLPGGNVLDLFSGSGNLGLEALSRGCSSAVFVEKNGKALSVIRNNIEALGCDERTSVIYDDAFKAIPLLADKKLKFDIIFIDPPYDTDIEAPIMNLICEYGIIENDGIITLEHLTSDIQPEIIKSLYRFDIRNYGYTSISFYKRGDTI